MEARFNKPIIRTIFNYIYNKNKNCIVGITGPVGLGKSVTAVNLDYIFSGPKKFNLEESLVYTVSDLLKRSLSFVKVGNKRLMHDITMENFKNIPDIRQWLINNMDKIKIKRGRFIIFDETGAGVFVREFMSLDNRTMGKLVQLWRILGIVLVVVIPEDINTADSIIEKFMNIEIKMMRIHKDEGYAECVAWEYIGRKKNREVIKRRLAGCRYGGVIKIKKLDNEIIRNYENISKVYKLESMIHMAMEQEGSTGKAGRDKKSTWEYATYVKNHIDEFRNHQGKLTNTMIRTKLGVGQPTASEIMSIVLTDAKYVDNIRTNIHTD